MALTPAQREAQRKLIGLVQRGGATWMNREEGLCIFRQELQSGFSVGAHELTEHLDALGIPFTITINYPMALGKRTVRGYKVSVAWGDLPAVTRWMPSLQKYIGQVEAGTD
jgi:hypothetical protein